MNCMKCGREVPQHESFCEECLADMEKYPIQTDTVVLLPHRRTSTAFKKTHQRRHTPEEQIQHLEKRCRRLTAALILATVLLAGALAALGVAVYEWDMYRFLGQNYNSSGAPHSQVEELVP